MKNDGTVCLTININELALRSKLLCSTMALAICCTSAFGAASAQESVSSGPQDEVAETDESKRLGTVTVTARKIEENLQEVPVAVTAFSGAELEAQGAIGFQDVSNFTPGLTTVGALGNNSALYLSMRGQVQNDTLATLEPSIGTYVDGHYWARAYGLTTDLLDVERVQVLKGPQGTLFGRNTTGGALVFETANPSFDGVYGSIKGTVGNYNEQAVEAIANIPVIDDKLAIRAAAKLQSRDGFVEDIISNEDYSDKHVSQARVKVLFEPTEKLTFDLSGEWFTYKTHPAFLPFYAGPGTRGISLGFPDPNFATIDEYLAQTTSGRDIAVDGRQFSKAETKTFTGTVTYDVSSTDQLKLIAGSRQVKTRQRGDLDGTPYLLNTTTLEQDLEHWSVELQYTGAAFANRLKYVVGATYFEEEGYDRSFTWAFPDAVNPTISQFYGFIDNTSTGIYAQGSYDLTEKLAVTLGIRNSSDEKGITTRNATLLRADPSVILFCANTQGTVADLCEVQEETPTFEEVSYTAGLDYQLRDNVLIYGKTSKGYRSGGHQLRAVDDISATPFGPETLTEYEVGLKSDLFNGRVRLNLAAYTNEIDGKQLSTIFVQPGTNQAFTLIQNAAQVETQGIEAEVTALVTDNLTISAGGALLDTEYSEFEDFSGDRSYERIPHVIGEEFSIAATYTKPLSFGDLSLRADYHWTGDYPTNPFTPAPGTTITPDIRAILDGTTSEAVGILGARATLSLMNNLELAVWGRNLTDELNYPNALYIGAPIDFVTRFPQAPRTFGASVTYKFGAAG